MTGPKFFPRAFKLSGLLVAATMSTALLAVPFAAFAADACGPMIKEIGEPRYRGQARDATRLCRIGYLLMHNDDRLIADWVVEDLTPKRFNGDADRNELKNPFARDPDLDQRNLGTTKQDYTNTRFDRGHLSPAEDHGFSTESMRQSFFMSNIAPQVGVGFNQHIWAYLEEWTRNWTCERGRVIAITGPIVEDEDRRLTRKNGQKPDNPAVIPAYFFKILYDPERKKAIAFILPNQKVETKGKDVWNVLEKFIVSVGEVEERTGLALLQGLSRRDRARVVAEKSVMWSRRAACE